ncbi:cytosolic sulfotransferase 5 [Phtheirospermum japonicum]|uniref:Sulfotransferase n=1 Tax=Phtheirospermum japonicum TaxID=374723 RepID=A0A830CAM6_9LAMI|nr:cytosolic sulfotransferase 5 [Phtheirospermum japonicum]
MPSEITPKYLQEEETLPQELKNIISTLPKEKGWLASHLYRYQGFWYPARHLGGVINCQNLFQPNETDVFLSTTPKSGTTWLKALVFTLTNRKTHPIAKNHPLLFSTHLPFNSLPEPIKQSPGCKVVYLCRNPKDIFVSLWHFTNSLKPQEAKTNSIEDVFDMFCRGVSLFGPLWDHVLEYWKQRGLAVFLGCPFSEGEEESGLADEILRLCSFDNLRALDINKNGKLSSGEENKAFFRRGVVGDWKNYLSAEMVEKIDGITKDKFGGSGLIV